MKLTIVTDQAEISARLGEISGFRLLHKADQLEAAFENASPIPFPNGDKRLGERIGQHIEKVEAETMTRPSDEEFWSSLCRSMRRERCCPCRAGQRNGARPPGRTDAAGNKWQPTMDPFMRGARDR